MHYKEYKTILSPTGGMNIYRGCTHGCIYCDSRSVCYQMTHDFEDIEVKSNVAAILEDQLRRRRKPCIISTGGMSDPYNPHEEKLGLTKQCLELIEKYKYGVTVLTKSARILRDTSILEAINRRTKCVVQLTLTTSDEELCGIIEPNVSTTFERFQVLEKMRDIGIPTVVWMGPILPFINDTVENLEGILSYCIKAGVRGIVSFGFGTTMREGSREYFYKKLDEHFPGMKERYIKVYGDRYECLSPNNDVLKKIFGDICRRSNIMYDIKEVFDYMKNFELKEKQMNLFEMDV